MLSEKQVRQLFNMMADATAIPCCLYAKSASEGLEFGNDKPIPQEKVDYHQPENCRRLALKIAEWLVVNLQTPIPWDQGGQS